MSDDVTRSLLARSKMGEMDRPQAASPTLLPTSSLPPPCPHVATPHGLHGNVCKSDDKLTPTFNILDAACHPCIDGHNQVSARGLSPPFPPPSTWHHPHPDGNHSNGERERERKRERALRCHDNRAGAEWHPFKPSTWL